MRVVLLLLLATLAGCASDGVSRAGDHEHGRFHECPDGTRLDPGSFPDHHQDGFDVASKCPQPGQAAKVGIEAPAEGVAYQELRIEWDITPAQGHHTQGTQLRLTFEGQETILAKEGSSMIPRTFRATWVPMEPGAYTLQAWAVIDGQEVTSDLHDIDIAEVEETGVVHDIHIRPGGPLARIDPDGMRMAPGDSVRWVNEDVVAQRIVLDGPERAEMEVEPQGSYTLTLFRLGVHEYIVENPTFGGEGKIFVEL